ncbi:MAG: GGDEF domain-containing protein [Pseudomonadota bacterium]
MDENSTLTRELDELLQLCRAAPQDAVSGLPNLPLFHQRLVEQLSRSRRDPAGKGALVMVDVNDFKTVNDRFGYPVGDEVLRDVATAVRTGLRSQDVFCRTGGDEFMILLPDTDARGARIVMARLRVAAIRAGAPRNIAVSISAGASTWPADGRRPAELIAKADAALCADRRRMRRIARRGPAAVGDRTKLRLVK